MPYDPSTGKSIGDLSSHFIFRRRKQVGTRNDVITAFVEGRTQRTSKAPVPGEHRASVTESFNGAQGATKGWEHDLNSYNTVVARRHHDASISVSPRRYSVSTSRLVRELEGRLRTLSYVPTGETREVEAKVPGRHGGFGIPWHATGWEKLPFIHHKQVSPEEFKAYHKGEQDKRDAEAAAKQAAKEARAEARAKADAVKGGKSPGQEKLDL